MVGFVEGSENVVAVVLGDVFGGLSTGRDRDRTGALSR